MPQEHAPTPEPLPEPPLPPETDDPPPITAMDDKGPQADAAQAAFTGAPPPGAGDGEPTVTPAHPAAQGLTSDRLRASIAERQQAKAQPNGLGRLGVAFADLAEGFGPAILGKPVTDRSLSRGLMQQVQAGENAPLVEEAAKRQAAKDDLARRLAESQITKNERVPGVKAPTPLDPSQVDLNKANAEKARRETPIKATSLEDTLRTEYLDPATDPGRKAAIEKVLKIGAPTAKPAPQARPYSPEMLASKKLARMDALGKIVDSNTPLLNIISEADQIVPGLSSGQFNEADAPGRGAVGLARMGGAGQAVNSFLGNDKANRLAAVQARIGALAGKADSGLVLNEQEVKRLNNFLGLGLGAPLSEFAWALKVVKRSARDNIRNKTAPYGVTGDPAMDEFAVKDTYRKMNPQAVFEDNPMFAGVDEETPLGNSGGTVTVKATKAGGPPPHSVAADSAEAKYAREHPELFVVE